MRIKRPDIKNAQSILEAAKKNIKFTLTLKATDESSSTIIRNVYESFRMLGDAIMVSKGIESKDHIAPINELISLNINTKKPLQTIDQLRSLRHNINYYGYQPTKNEAEYAISIVKGCFNQIYKKLKEDIIIS